MVPVDQALGRHVHIITKQDEGGVCSQGVGAAKIFLHGSLGLGGELGDCGMVAVGNKSMVVGFGRCRIDLIGGTIEEHSSQLGDKITINLGLLEDWGELAPVSVGAGVDVANEADSSWNVEAVVE